MPKERKRVALIPGRVRGRGLVCIWWLAAEGVRCALVDLEGASASEATAEL